MYKDKQEEIKYLLEKESTAKNYMLVSFMFGVFFIAVLKDLIYSDFQLSSIIIKLALMTAFIFLAVQFHMQSNDIFEEEEIDKLDDHHAFLNSNQIEGSKETFFDKYFIKSDLRIFKKIIYTFWTAIFVIFMILTMISFAGK